MNRALLNVMIDSIAAALLTAMVGTGYILWFALPPGTNRTHLLWGLLRHQWGAVHFWMSATLLVVLAVHVALHWRWLLMGLSRRFGVGGWAERSPHLAGLVLLAAAAVPLTALAIGAHVSVQAMDPPLHPLDDEPRAGASAVTPTAGPASNTRPHSRARPTPALWRPRGPRRCWRNGARPATARARPPPACVLTHPTRSARRRAAPGGLSRAGPMRADCSRSWPRRRQPVRFLRDTAWARARWMRCGRGSRP